MRKIISYILDADHIWERILLVLVYLFIYDYLFHDFVFNLFEYLGGIEYKPMDLSTLFIWIVFSLIPFLFYTGINNISSYITLFLYIFVYIPFLHAIDILWNLDFLLKVIISGVLCIFFSLYMNIGRRWNLLKGIIIIPEMPFRWVEYMVLIMTFIFVAFNFHRMHFVNIFTQQDILYDLRLQNSEEMGTGNVFAYIQGWLSGALYPFLLINYLKQRKWLSALCILGGYLLVFMVDMQKLTFFMPFALTILYFLIRINVKTICKRLHSFIMGALIFISIILMGLQSNEIVFTIASIIILRTICVTGWLTQMYFYFFLNGNKFTHYSHISFVNMITNSYPYDVPLGMAVSYNSQNANATFFLTDGYAAWGVLGLIIIGIIFYLFLELLNAISYRYKLEDLLVLFLPTISYLLNASLFTTFLSNGLFILIILITSSQNYLTKENTQ